MHHNPPRSRGGSLNGPRAACSDTGFDGGQLRINGGWATLVARYRECASGEYDLRRQEDWNLQQCLEGTLSAIQAGICATSGIVFYGSRPFREGGSGQPANGYRLTGSRVLCRCVQPGQSCGFYTRDEGNSRNIYRVHAGAAQCTPVTRVATTPPYVPPYTTTSITSPVAGITTEYEFQSLGAGQCVTADNRQLPYLATRLRGGRSQCEEFCRAQATCRGYGWSRRHGSVCRLYTASTNSATDWCGSRHRSRYCSGAMSGWYVSVHHSNCQWSCVVDHSAQGYGREGERRRSEGLTCYKKQRLCTRYVCGVMTCPSLCVSDGICSCTGGGTQCDAQWNQCDGEFCFRDAHCQSGRCMHMTPGEVRGRCHTTGMPLPAQTNSPPAKPVAGSPTRISRPHRNTNSTLPAMCDVLLVRTVDTSPKCFDGCYTESVYGGEHWIMRGDHFVRREANGHWLVAHSAGSRRAHSYVCRQLLSLSFNTSGHGSPMGNHTWTRRFDISGTIVHNQKDISLECTSRCPTSVYTGHGMMNVNAGLLIHGKLKSALYVINGIIATGAIILYILSHLSKHKGRGSQSPNHGAIIGVGLGLADIVTDTFLLLIFYASPGCQDLLYWLLGCKIISFVFNACFLAFTFKPEQGRTAFLYWHLNHSSKFKTVVTLACFDIRMIKLITCRIFGLSWTNANISSGTKRRLDITSLISLLTENLAQFFIELVMFLRLDPVGENKLMILLAMMLSVFDVLQGAIGLFVWFCLDWSAQMYSNDDDSYHPNQLQYSNNMDGEEIMLDTLKSLLSTRVDDDLPLSAKRLAAELSVKRAESALQHEQDKHELFGSAGDRSMSYAGDGIYIGAVDGSALGHKT